jgi:biopolymer transport protein ExbD
MIDMAFLLIVFFVLVARMGSDEAPAIALPVTPRSPAHEPPGTARIAVNVLATPSGTVVAVGTRRFAGDEAVEGVAATVAARLAREPGVPVDVRADAALAYSEVEPVLKGIALAAERSGPTRVSVRVCALGEGSGG